jgi:hypothetical protein
MGMDGVTSLIREKWQPACFAGNLKLIRYTRALYEENIEECFNRIRWRPLSVKSEQWHTYRVITGM